MPPFSPDNTDAQKDELISHLDIHFQNNTSFSFSYLICLTYVAFLLHLTWPSHVPPAPLPGLSLNVTIAYPSCGRLHILCSLRTMYV